jgi:hypothetical protein
MRAILGLGLRTARLEFEKSLYAVGVGVSATLKRRNSKRPSSSGSERTPAYGEADPLVAGWKARYADPALYSATVTIQIAFEKPSQLMAIQPIAVLEGQTVAYTALSVGAVEGDVIVADGIYYDVVSARPSSPAMCQLLTIKRIN